MGVTGIGGLFFRAKDPKALAAWYQQHLNVGAGCVATPGTTPEKYSWSTEGGPVVFQPFKATTDYWPADRQYMLNLRVHDLDGLIASLTALSIPVVTKPEWNDPYVGKFARIHDPEAIPSSCGSRRRNRHRGAGAAKPRRRSCSLRDPPAVAPTRREIASLFYFGASTISICLPSIRG